MATQREFLEAILARFSHPGEVACRAMMGDYVLYYKGKVIGGLYDNRLLVKNLAPARALLPLAATELPYDGCKPMLRVMDISNRPLLLQLAESLAAALPDPKSRKK